MHSISRCRKWYVFGVIFSVTYPHKTFKTLVDFDTLRTSMYFAGGLPAWAFVATSDRLRYLLNPSQIVTAYEFHKDLTLKMSFNVIIIMAPENGNLRRKPFCCFVPSRIPTTNPKVPASTACCGNTTTVYCYWLIACICFFFQWYNQSWHTRRINQ